MDQILSLPCSKRSGTFPSQDKLWGLLVPPMFWPPALPLTAFPTLFWLTLLQPAGLLLVFKSRLLLPWGLCLHWHHQDCPSHIVPLRSSYFLGTLIPTWFSFFSKKFIYLACRSCFCSRWAPRGGAWRAWGLIGCFAACGTSVPEQGSNHVPCVGRQILNLWTAREVPGFLS